MVRSLRLRFFLISWPMVVAAVAGVALTFDRWAAVEFRVLEEDQSTPSGELLLGGAAQEAMDSALALVRRWSASAGDADELVLALATVARRGAVDFVVTDSTGAVLVSTDATLSLEEPAQGTGTDTGTEATFRRTLTGGGTVLHELIRVGGSAVQEEPGVAGVLYLLPAARALPDADGEQGPDVEALRRTLHSDARRTLVWAFIVASLVSAALTLLLARPVVAQVGRLVDAAATVRGGDLSIRLDAAGRDELGELERSFNAMTQALEQADLHKRTLVTDVAHELRTPLANVVGMIEALQDGLREADADTLGVLRAEAGLLTELVADLQELSLAESGQMTFDLATVDAAAEARAAVTAMAATAGGVTLTGPGAEEKVSVRADARRLGQVLRNLLRNALAQTPPGGRVAITVYREAGWVVVAVEDTGRGIPADHLERIWERFHRVDPSRDRASGGRGLGLAIVRHLVEGMGGRVAVTSEVDRGSRFLVRLPAAEPGRGRECG